MFVTANIQSFTSQIVGAVSPLGEKNLTYWLVRRRRTSLSFPEMQVVVVLERGKNSQGRFPIEKDVRPLFPLHENGDNKKFQSFNR